MSNPFFSRKGLLIGTLAAFLILRRCYFRYWDPNLIITFFDVGQGDSALIQFPYGKTMLIDGGGGWETFSLGERVLIPELSRLGILRLDHVVLSHPDNDHAFGLLAILKKLEVGELWLSRDLINYKKPKLLTKIEEVSQIRNVTINRLMSPYQLRINGVRARLIPLSTAKRSRNNQALIVDIEFGKCKALFTGDIERESEWDLGHNFPAKVHLLKVPHHGSLTSSTPLFLKSFSPKWAVVSVGLKNQYGHPRSEVLSRYRSFGTQLFRTDFHGAVRFKITPQGNVRCETYLGDCGVSQCE